MKNGRITELMRKYPNLHCDISGRITAETYRKVARENAIKMLGLK